MSGKRGAEGDAAGEVVDALHAAIDTCARAAEAELRRHDDGGEKLPLLPELVELLKVGACIRARGGGRGAGGGV
jgi:hypothetical protein